jgi:glycosyltransferase involved in cell wall biosynthesis
MLEEYARYFVEHYGADVELLVVVNGSTDRTEEIAREFAATCPRVVPIIENSAIGKGGAIMLGMARSRGELVGFVDADNSTPPHAFDDLVKHIGEAGVIIASRWIKGAEVSPPQPLKRRIASRIFNKLVRLLFGFRISDTQCGAKLMKRETVEKVLPKLGIARWAFDVDLLFQVHRAGYDIVEWPTIWHDAAGSRLRVARVSCEMFLAICRLRLLYSPFKWIVSVYDHSLGRIIKLRA